ncbi:g284 [Coccomyxa viridis]|uniref:G284 protein n=1 Tax=Coccomyxa viridis TaxID=1274662 RepID=A0ABP1FFC6_9CHLO
MAVAALTTRKEQLETELRKCESALFAAESEYLQADHSQCGSVLKGFEGFLSSKDTLRKRARAYRPEDKIFSLSSKSSPATQELEESQTMAEELGGVMGPGRGKVIATKGSAQKGWQ